MNQSMNLSISDFFVISTKYWLNILWGHIHDSLCRIPWKCRELRRPVFHMVFCFNLEYYLLEYHDRHSKITYLSLLLSSFPISYFQPFESLLQYFYQPIVGILLLKHCWLNHLGVFRPSSEYNDLFDSFVEVVLSALVVYYSLRCSNYYTQ